MEDSPFSELHTFSLERLIQAAYAYGLLTNYDMTPRLVRLVFREETVERDPEEARLYLIALLRDHQGFP